MQKRNVRVIVASEYPQARDFLKQVVEKAEGIFWVGQSRDVTKTLTLARNLRPDAAIIDCFLPYPAGLDTDRLSRLGGLDTAQAITEEMPNTRVILLNNLDTEVSPKHSPGPNGITFFSRETLETSIPFTLQDLYHEMEMPGGLVFANVQTRPGTSLRQKVANLSDKAVLFGGLGMLGGLILMPTMVWAEAGFILAIAGASTMFLGMAGKVTASLRHRAAGETDPATRD
jgi:hypothetical protein